MTDYTRLLNELGDLRREVLDATREARGAQRAVASIMRRGRVQLIAKEHDDGWRRLAPDVGLVQWDPRRANEPVTPDLSGSLVARLRRGDPVSDQLGNTAAIGLVNVLANPLLEGMADISPGTTQTTWGKDWYGQYVVNSGASPSGTVLGLQADRDATSQHPYNSGLAQMAFNATAATDITMWVVSAQYLPSFDHTAPPFLAASAQLSRFMGTNHANLTRLDAWVEIVKDTTVAASSPVYDLKSAPFPGTYATVRATAVVAEPVDGWSAHAWFLRIMVRAAYSGTTGGYKTHLYFAEPQLTLSTSQSAPPFGPLVGRWVPQVFSTYYANGTQPVLTVGALSGLTYSLVWGPGGAGDLDTALARPAAATLRILNPYGGTDDEALELGDTLRIACVSTGRVSLDSKGSSAATELAIVSTSGQRAKIEARVSGDSESRFALWGDATMQGLEFGPGNAANDVNLYRASADVLKTDDSLAVVGKLILPPTATQTLAAGTTVLANAATIQINSSGNVTLTATPTIADGTDGQLLTIINVDTADTITLQDQGTLGSSNLRLTATTVALGPRQSVQLMYSSTIGDWVQIGNKVTVL